MENKICCDSMKYHLNFKCNTHKDDFDCKDFTICKELVVYIYFVYLHKKGECFCMAELNNYSHGKGVVSIL